MTLRQEDAEEWKYEVAKLRRAVCGKEGGMVGKCAYYGMVGQSRREWRGRWKAKRKYEVKEIGATKLRRRVGGRSTSLMPKERVAPFIWACSLIIWGFHKMFKMGKLRHGLRTKSMIRITGSALVSTRHIRNDGLPLD